MFNFFSWLVMEGLLGGCRDRSLGPAHIRFSTRVGVSEGQVTKIRFPIRHAAHRQKEGPPGSEQQYVVSKKRGKPGNDETVENRQAHEGTKGRGRGGQPRGKARKNTIFNGKGAPPCGTANWPMVDQTERAGRIWRFRVGQGEKAWFRVYEGGCL